MGSIRQEVYDNSKLTQKDLDIAKIFCSVISKSWMSIYQKI